MALLEARGISFGYGRGVPILDGWDARFEAGEVVAITGPSGRGKSTLLYLLGLMLAPRAGQVLVDGADAASQRDAARARMRAGLFGFVFQDAALDATRTVLDNVIETALYRGQPREEAKARALELMAQFGVDLRATHKPGQVSGGQAQRIALCRALLNRPRILLADEPTGNLDQDSATVVVDAMRSHAVSGSTVIVATHDPALVARCDRVIQL
ncbi:MULTISPECIES: ABC transporter ATP-binding protein [unclassified Cryobacterium]|uniref:ABC transporter ATP-binding protein n=1 Tax=unclassified Cryobacterium TaxID=2649013 RepID=UPI001445264D|nr:MULTISPECIES: ATP-binding cassette domain-containing protein [unclassified Cryobacterium]